MENLIIQPQEYRQLFSGVVQVGEHCDWDVITNYIRERQNIDLFGLLGSNLFTQISLDPLQDRFSDLLNGSNYEDCNGNTALHFGLKRVLTHYAYGAYLYRKSFVDVPFGVVVKQSQDSVPVPSSELRNLHDEHRKIAYEYWLGVQKFICSNKELKEVWGGKCDCDCKDEPKGAKSTRTTRIKLIRRNG